MLNVNHLDIYPINSFIFFIATYYIKTITPLSYKNNLLCFLRAKLLLTYTGEDEFFNNSTCYL